jgi:hypothetical protein
MSEALTPGRLTSVVHIMNGRWSAISHLGVLDLDGNTLSLWDRKGERLFAVPAETIRGRALRRRSVELHPNGFELDAAGRRWYLVAHVTPAKSQRQPTRALVQRYGARELVPRPAGMSEETYRRLTKNLLLHQGLWGVYWVNTLDAIAARAQGRR